MKIRADLAEMLRAGAKTREIRGQLGVSLNLIADTRKALRLPVPPRARPKRTAEQGFAEFTEQLEDGHVRWTGGWAGRSPQLSHDGRQESALRVAFRIQHGRDPVGYVKAACGMDGCVAPAHVEDRPLRKKTAKAFNAIFGAALEEDNHA